MPKLKCCKLSGSKKHNLAKEKIDRAKSAIASVPRLDSYIAHLSKVKVTTQSKSESQTDATPASELVLLSQANNLQLQDHEVSPSDSDGQQLQSQSVTGQGS